MLIASLKGLKAKNTDLAKYWQENAISVDPLQVFDITGKGGWFLGSPAEFLLKKKIETNGKPLKDWDIKIYRGILTGLNEAFIIDTATKERLCQQDPKSAEIIKPILRGRDIKRYGYKWADLWVINSHNGYKNTPELKLTPSSGGKSELEIAPSKGLHDSGGVLPIDINDYPAIKKHLDQFEPALSKRSDKGKTPYNLRHCAYLEEFQKEKVVWGNISYNSQFCFVDSGVFVNAPANIMTSETIPVKYLIGIMNSKIFNYDFKSKGIFLGDAFEWKKSYVEQVNLPILDTPEKQDLAKQIEALVEEILRLKNVAETTVFPKKTQTKLNINGDATNGDTVVASTEHLEVQIDQLVYQLYDLTTEEIRVIEG